MNYVDMKMLAQVHRIRNPSETEEAQNNDPDSDFVICTFPQHEGDKLLGITEQVCMITILGDRGTIFFDNGFVDEKNMLWSAHNKRKLANPFSSAVSSFMKRPIMEGAYNTDERCEIFCYTPQLCNRVEKANTHNGMTFIPFTEVNKENFRVNFYPLHLVGNDANKKASTRKAVQNVARMMCNENKQRIISNLENVAKHLPNDREFIVCGEKYNNFSDSRLILD